MDEAIKPAKPGRLDAHGDAPENLSDRGEARPDAGHSRPGAFDPEGARRHLGVDEENFGRIFECIWLEVSQRRSLLEEAFAAGDFGKVILHAHTIKSSCATIGAEALSRAAAAVEQAAAAGCATDLARALGAFRAAKETLSKLLGMG